jgi:hypothetical protein
MAGFTAQDFQHPKPIEPSERNSIEEKNVIVKEEPLPAVIIRPANQITNQKLENFKNNFLKKANLPNSITGSKAQTIADTILSNMTEMHSPGNFWLNHNGQSTNDLHQQHKTSVELPFSPNQGKTLPPSTQTSTTNVQTTESYDSDKSILPLLSSNDGKNKMNQRGSSISSDSSVTASAGLLTTTTKSQPLTNGPSTAVGEECTLTDDELRSIKLRNNNVRQLIYKEVKKPGKVHQDLWNMLDNDLHGPPWIRRQFIQEVKLEALRFKRSVLAIQLEDKCKSLS